MSDEKIQRADEMRFGRIVARPWGGEPPAGYQGLQIGYYGEGGEFVVVAIVEEDRLNMRRETGLEPFGEVAFPMKWEFESQIKTLAFATDADVDPEAVVNFGPEDEDGLPTWADFMEAARGNERYAGLLAERCGAGGAFEGCWPAAVVEQDLIEGEVEFVGGELVLTGRKA